MPRGEHRLAQWLSEFARASGSGVLSESMESSGRFLVFALVGCCLFSGSSAQAAAGAGSAALPVASAPSNTPPVAEPSLIEPSPTSASPRAAVSTVPLPWQSQAGSPLAAQPMIDIPLTLGLGAVLLGIELVAPQLPGPSCGPVCNADTINALDRTVVGWHSPAARTASNVLIGFNIALPFALDLLDVAANRPPHAVTGYLQDALILGEVFVVNAALNTAFKYAVRRPRPFMYEPEPGPGSEPGVATLEDRQDSDAGLSFYSQHSSTAFSLATAYSYLFSLRHPGSRWIVPVWLLSEGLAATTATLRVLAGKHFWTDVLVGAVAGSAIGLLIPFVHRRSLPAGSGLQRYAWLRDLRISAAPMLSSDGGGLTLSIESR